MKPIAILFAREDSVYRTIEGCDVWDIARDARNWPGGCPVVAHPPCRAWGRLRAFANPRSDEKDLARWAVAQIREHGGVLEHPASSSLWVDQSLPRPGCGRDAHGGFSIAVLQKWWGHRADKATWLYCCGIEPRDVPATPIIIAEATHIVSSSLVRKGHPRWKPHLEPAERERTPPAFALWLVALARLCRAP
jgi:hypothetical protein